MGKLGIVRFTGKSGDQYKFNAYPLQAGFRKGLGAVYVVTQRRQVESSGAFKHRKICMGQTGDLRESLAGEGESLAARGGNCVCVHGEKDEAARMQIQQDLTRKRRSGENS